MHIRVEPDVRQPTPTEPRDVRNQGRIVYDMASAREFVTGVKVYMDELVRSVRASTALEVVCISNRPAVRRGGIWSIWNLFRHMAWTQLILPLKVLRLKPDILHASTFAPILCSRPVVLTLYDTLYLTHPEPYRNKLIPLYTRHFIAASARRADIICTISELSRREIASAYGIADSRIRIVYPGLSSRFQPQSAEAIDEVRRKYDLKQHYFLFVGAWGRRKNLIKLIDAFRMFRDKVSVHHELVLVGPRERRSEVSDRLKDSDVGRCVRSLGFVPDDDMPALYGACDAFVFPSLAEGFGLPLIEAMACGAPVLSSSASCMPEVAGDAALYFDPTDATDMVRAMTDVLDPGMRQRLIDSGFRRSKLFAWSNVAKEMQIAYSDALEQFRRR